MVGRKVRVTVTGKCVGLKGSGPVKADERLCRNGGQSRSQDICLFDRSSR